MNLMKSMIRGVRSPNACFFALIVFCICNGTFSCLHVASADETSISVRSLYLDSISNKWEKEIIWVFNVKDSACITVTRGNRTEPDLTIRYLPDGLLEEVEDHVSGIHRNRQAKGDKIVLSWGFPVPYDYLAPFDDSISEAVIKKVVGGAIFSYRLKREISYISLNQAMAEGMVDGEIAGDFAGKALRLITVRKAGNLMVRQLWPEGASWWVYEETPHRKSWRK